MQFKSFSLKHAMFNNVIFLFLHALALTDFKDKVKLKTYELILNEKAVLFKHFLKIK